MSDTLPQELARQYETRFNRAVSYRQRVWQILIHVFFQKLIPAHGAVLDLGCGWGEFINQVMASRKYGMDLNPDSPAHLDASVEFKAQDCSQTWDLPDKSLDVVFTSNFFEHLPDKAALKATLEQAYRCLKPGGCLICLGPNIKYLPGAYWDFWDHYLPLTELSLAEGLSLAGFRVERNVARFLPYSMSQGFQPPLFFLQLYLRLPFFWRFFGRQFLVVARRDAE